MTKILFYHLTPEEILALYKFFRNEYVNPKNRGLIDVIDHISKIVESHEFPNRNNQAT
jgi:hypothetical protein